MMHFYCHQRFGRRWESVGGNQNGHNLLLAPVTDNQLEAGIEQQCDAYSRRPSDLNQITVEQLDYLDIHRHAFI